MLHCMLLLRTPLTAMPQVITALGSLEELAIKNSRLSAFPEQLIDMSGGLRRGCARES